jgi:hypothetical protein
MLKRNQLACPDFLGFMQAVQIIVNLMEQSSF